MGGDDEGVIGGRPRGISANIPQSAIDDMLREHPLDGSTPEIQPTEAGLDNSDFVNGTTQVSEMIQPRGATPVKKATDQVQETEMSPPKKKVVVPMRQITLPEEPTKENTDSLELIFRMPLSGIRVNRRFLKTETVQILYDFID